MGSILIEQWLGPDRIEVRDEASVAEVRERVREVARIAKLPAIRTEDLAAAASELAHNQLAHAIGGAVAVRAIERVGVAGVEVIACDRGGGIEDPTTALAGIPRAEGSLGVGLSATARQADELDVDIRWGEGSCIAIRAFANRVRRCEVGVLARVHPQEVVIGDHAVLLRDAVSTTIAVADGLGHGPEARRAAEHAIAQVAPHAARSLPELFAGAHAATHGSRGAVMAIGRVGVDGHLEYAGVGNIGACVIGVDGIARPLPSISGTLGTVLPRRIHVEHLTLAAGELFVLFSDGLTSRIDLTGDKAMLRRHPIVIAQTLLSRFGRGSDDALVAVVRG